MFSSCDLEKQSVNAVSQCSLPAGLLHSCALWDKAREILLAVSEDLRVALTQTALDGQDTSKYIINTGLDTTNVPW